ncbi:MAG: aminotransferase class IV [Pseudomonadota bacterium]
MANVLGMAYLDGELLPVEEARIPVLDRGFLFGDAVYEVIAAYDGLPFLTDRHLARLARSLAFIACANPFAAEDWAALLHDVLSANAQLVPPRAALYVQVTRGDSPKRAHTFPATAEPRTLVMLMDSPPPPAAAREAGLHAVTLDDLRWRACHIKTTSLLGNVLAREQARAAGAAEALLHRDGLVNEGSTSNVLAWIDDTLVSPPDGPDILPGVSRDWVLEQAAQAGVRCERRPIALQALREAEEVWITSTTREVLPVTRLDEHSIGDGRPGRHWRDAWDRYRASVAAGGPEDRD